MAETGTTTSEAQQWAEGLSSLGQRIGGRFARAEPRRRALAYLQGLLSPLERKNGWQLAEEAGDATPYGVQHLLGRAQWEADAVRNDLCAYVVEHLGDKQAVLIVDETGFVKKGAQSVGVQRQYSGTAGRIENCQIGVFLVYASAKGRTFLDRELYLPQAWTQDKPRCQQAGVPDTVGFTTKPMLAKQMIARALAARVPARWVSGDSVYGNDGKLRGWLEAQHLAHVLGVSGNHYVWLDFQQRPVAMVVQRMPCQAWQRLSAGSGSKGPRWFDWAALRLPGAEGGWQRWSKWRAHAGRWKNVLRRLRGKWAWTNTKCAVGQDGTGISPWCCSHTPTSPSCGRRRRPLNREKKRLPPYPPPPHSTAAADRARGAASDVGVGVEAGCPGGRTAWLVPMATPTSSRSAAVALSAADQGRINYLQL